jgi:hypothetical protein
MLHEPVQLLDGPLVHDVAGVEHRRGLEEQNVDLLVCDGPMLDASRDENEFAFRGRS